MNHPLGMCILQCIGNLFHIGDNRDKWKWHALFVMLAQGPMGRVAHHEKWRFSFYAKVQYPYDMGMFQVSNEACLCTELLNVITEQLSAQDFDGRFRFEVKMFSEIDLSEAAFSKEANKAIISKLLS